MQQKKTITGTTSQSTAFGLATNFITVHADAACYIDIGLSPTATTSTTHLPSGVFRSFKVKSGHKVAVKDTA